MSNLKRMVSSILVLAMIATSGVFALGTFAADEPANFIAEESAVELRERDFVVAEKLQTFGIIDSFDAAKLMSIAKREDVIDVLMSYLGVKGATSETTSSPFIDVRANDKNIDAYNFLYQSGYISGDENRKFSPAKNLTYNEAVTFVINVMGYKVSAARHGGYPEGYLYTASKYDLLGGLRGSGNDPIPFCDLYTLIERSLEADAVAERIYTGDGDAQFVLREGYTVLEELFGVKSIKGIVTGTENTRLMAADSSLINMHQIEIDGVIYETGNNTFSEYLGMYVTAYGKKNDNSEYEIIFLEASERRNHEYEISAENLLPAKTTNEKIYYVDEEYKEKHLKVNSTTLSVIYNGKMYTGYGALKNALPANGYIRGLDNTGDEVIDVLFVYEFENYIVGSFDSFTQVYYDKYNPSKTLLLDTEASDVRVYDANGKETTLQAITAGDLISVMESENSGGYKLISVYLCGETVSGTITDELSNGAYVIEGENYYLAQNVIDYISAGKLPSVGLGTSAVFYLDIEGRIANYTFSTSTDKTFGFFAGVDSDPGLDKRISLKIFTEDSTWVDANVTDVINIDGYRYKIASQHEFETAVASIPVGEVVLFSMLGDKVNYIDTAALNKGNLTAAADIGNLNCIMSGEQFYHRRGVCHNGSDPSKDKFVMSTKETCIIFNTPARGELLSDLTKYSITNTLNRYVYGPGNGSGSQVVSDGVAVYNLGKDDFNIAKCIMLRGTTSRSASVGSTTGFVIITKLTNAVDAEGAKCQKLYYAENGVESSALIKDTIGYGYSYVEDGSSASDATFADTGLEVGDVARISVDGDGYVTEIEAIYRQNQAGPKASEAWMTYMTAYMDAHQTKGSYACGRFKTYDPASGIMQFELETSGVTKSYNAIVSSAKVSTYRHSAKLAEPATLADLVPGDMVLLRSDSYSIVFHQIIILK